MYAVNHLLNKTRIANSSSTKSIWHQRGGSREAGGYQERSAEGTSDRDHTSPQMQRVLRRTTSLQTKNRKQGLLLFGLDNEERIKLLRKCLAARSQVVRWKKREKW